MNRIISGLLGLLLSAVVCSAHGATLSVCNTPAALTAGNSGTVDICIAGMVDGGAPSLGVYDIVLGFNSAVLSLAGVSFGDPVLGDQLDLFSLGSIQSVVPGAASVALFELSLDTVDDLNNLQAGDFVLARLSFDAIAEGLSPLTLTVNSIGDALGDPLIGLAVQDGSLTVAAAPTHQAPEPASWLLVMIAILGTTVRERRVLRSYGIDE